MARTQTAISGVSIVGNGEKITSNVQVISATATAGRVMVRTTGAGTDGYLEIFVQYGDGVNYDSPGAIAGTINADRTALSFPVDMTPPEFRLRLINNSGADVVVENVEYIELI